MLSIGQQIKFWCVFQGSNYIGHAELKSDRFENLYTVSFASYVFHLMLANKFRLGEGRC